ncbi:MAG: hypothetical protein ACOYOY_12255, partial [Planktothrix agardhii]
KVANFDVCLLLIFTISQSLFIPGNELLHKFIPISKIVAQKTKKCYDHLRRLSYQLKIKNKE